VVKSVPVALEVGKARTFATALDWPGWCRSGKSEDLAIEALMAHAPRYQAVVGGIPPRFIAPRPGAPVEVVERLTGNASTEFGAPGVPPVADHAAVDARDLRRLGSIMEACWSAFDRAVAAAAGLTLRTGPRGGGRDLDTIREHAAEADRAYLARLGGRVGKDADHTTVRAAFLEALGARARGEVADVGPRGGKRWSARFAVRYAAWHTLDHTWEIEDRSRPQA
jgi:hypothetical protein